MITVAGWPRSGTHWLKAMLEYALGEKLAHSHSCDKIATEQYVLIVRDPRDAFASHWRLHQRNHLGEATELEFMQSFFQGRGADQHEWNVGWLRYTEQLLEWSALYPHYAPLVLYEQLYQTPRETLLNVLETIGRPDVPRDRIARAIQFTRGRRCDPSGLPVDEDMGKPGKGKAQLSEPTLRFMCCRDMVELWLSRRDEKGIR